MHYVSPRDPRNIIVYTSCTVVMAAVVRTYAVFSFRNPTGNEWPSTSARTRARALRVDFLSSRAFRLHSSARVLRIDTARANVPIRISVYEHRARARFPFPPPPPPSALNAIYYIAVLSRLLLRTLSCSLHRMCVVKNGREERRTEKRVEKFLDTRHAFDRNPYR